MDFFDQEAEESGASGSESENEVIQKVPKKKEKKSRKKRIDDDEEEDDEDDEEQLAMEMKDLINDEVEEEESEDENDDDGKRKHESEEEDDDQLEDDDYDLIEENLGIKVSRKPKKRKRIRVVSEDEDSDTEMAEGTNEEKRQEIANTLFDDDDDEAAEESAVPVSEREEEPKKDDLALDLEGSEEEESDIDDFIVDEEGQPISKGKKKKPVIHSDKSLQIAQDIFGVDFDFAEFDQYDEEEDEEDYDEYDEEAGEESETVTKTKKKSKRATKKSIYEVYEPSELERGHFTDLDNEIRTVDIPERFQLRQIRVTATEEGELDEEAEWIYKQAFINKPISKQSDAADSQYTYHQQKGSSTVSKIRDALNFMRNQLLEVPFIAFYRKEYVEPELNINDLWRVWQFDEKWTQLRSRKQNLVRLFEKMQNYQFEENSDPDKVLDSRPLTADDVHRVKRVQTLEELRDCYQHFLLHYGADIPKMRNMEKRKKNDDENPVEEQQPEEPVDNIKQATRKTGYDICLQAKLDDIAQKFGLTPEQFGENLRDNYQRHEVDQCPGEPSELAKDCICGQFPTEEDVLMGARHIVAMQIAHDPLVRQCIREAYFERAKIRTRPTKKGLKEVDESHSCFGWKYLRNKPVIDLKEDAYVKLSQAEDDGLLKIEFSMDNFTGSTQTYFKEIQQLYYRDEFSKLVQQWNTQRSQALERALTKILYPQMEKEIRSKLLTEGRDYVQRACCRKLHNWLKVAPYQVDQQLDDDYDYDDNNNGVKVMGVAYSTDRDTPAFATIIDGNGQVTDFLRLQDLTKRRNAWRPKDKESKEKDISKLKNFMAKKKPHAVAVTGESRDSLMIIDDIKAIVSELEQEDLAPINVELMEHDLALVYENSNRAMNEFRDYPPVLRHAVSIARRLQDPLIEFASLCNPDEDILCLKYHPLQDCLPKEVLLNALHLEFINRVNEVGVDVNQALDFSHHASLLQFVCGLGPRKGSHLCRILKQNNSRLENRTQLVTVCHMGPKVFINCAGFIKIDTSSLGDSTEAYVEVLDGSRVHPETYEWARKMAVDALEYDDTAEDANPAGALEEILESPERLKDLDLDAFAEELDRQGYGNKHITLYDIRAELNHRYKDLRTPFRPPNSEEKFNMLTKETPTTFYVGKLVLCCVTGIARKRPQGEQLDEANPVRNEETGLWQCPFCQKKDFPELSEVWSHFDAGNCPGSAVGVKVRLDNSVSGFILTKMISDKQVTNPEDRVKVGQTLHCRISKIDIDRFQVELTCRSSDLQDKDGNWKPQRDLYFDYDAEKSDVTKDEDRRKVQARQTYIKRVIVHPTFHNISFKECEKLMVGLDQGEVIIRPSSKGADHLTVTWKTAEEVLQHIDVREEGKENAFSLGRSLWIGNEEFEDLDEIIARHIQPMAAFARDIIHFKYYKEGCDGKKDAIDKSLIEEKKKAPSRIPYLMTVSYQFPGKFMLSYLPRTKPRHEYVTVTPDGIRYRSQSFHSLNSLVRWFKEHFREPVPGTPSSSSRTPAPPFTTPALTMQGVDAATIQRAAAGLPNNIYNTLAQVASGTPQHIANSANYAGAYSGSNYYQPMATPMMTPMLTPSYHGQTLQATPAHSLATPSYQPTPRSTIWPGATPSRTPQRTQPRPTTSSTDWAKAAEMWAKRKQSGASTPKPGTPRHSSSSSPAVRPNSEGAGDATPLIDER